MFTILPDAQTHNKQSYPSAVIGDGDLPSFITENKRDIKKQLTQTGTVLFRGFNVPSATDFDAVVKAYGAPSFAYEGSLSNAVRVNITPRVFTANEAPPDVSIYLHHEMAQTPVFPSALFFYCEIKPGSGGATPLCRSDILFERLAATQPELMQKFEALGVRYTHTMPDRPDPQSGQGRSWHDTLGAQTAAQAEFRLTELGYSWTWKDNDSLCVTSPRLNAVRALDGGDRAFFNQLIAAFRGWSDSRNDARKSVNFGDGSPINGADMASAISMADALSYDLNWEAGDVALIDNYRVMHGRRPFTGRRRVLASLIA